MEVGFCLLPVGEKLAQGCRFRRLFINAGIPLTIKTLLRISMLLRLNE
jgi:hypothetical protein